MNCCKCGKRLLAGAALCLTCEKDYESVPDANTRIGYYARHPGALIPARHDVLFGPLVICRITSGGKFADVAEEDLRTVDDSLLLITHVCGGAKTDD